MTRRSLSTRDRVAIFTAAHGRCHICQQLIRPAEPWEAEHPIPHAIGGSDEIADLKPAHVRCHQAKTADDVTAIAKTKRIAAKHIGAHRTASPMAGSRRSGWKHLMSGKWERR
jgi:5-methylcytosine-specific restriction enzyme A